MDKQNTINDLIVDINWYWKKINNKKVSIRERREALSYIIQRIIFNKDKYRDTIDKGLYFRLNTIVYELIDYQVVKTNKKEIDKLVDYIVDYFEEVV